MQARNDITRWSIALLAAGLIALPVAATEKPGVELGFDVGHVNFDSEVSDDDATAFGLRGGYHFNKWFLLEGQLGTASGHDFSGDSKLNTMFVNSVFNFKVHPRVRPYLLAGVGRANLEFTGFGLKVDDTDTAYQMAAGSRFLFSDTGRMSARVEVSRMREGTFSETSNHTNVTTGLSWRLGRKS